MARKRDIDRLTVKWRDRLWLGQWLISTELVDSLNDGTGVDNWETTAQVHIQSQYRKALVSVAKGAWDTTSEKQRNRTICHEMVHVAMSPLDDLTEALAAALPASRREGYVEWWGHLKETACEQWANVLLEAYKELK